MPVLSLNFNEPAWPELDRDRIIHVGEGAPPIGVAVLEGGMASGAPSVALRVDLPDGKVVVAETSLKLFLAAADALKARFGDPR